MSKVKNKDIPNKPAVFVTQYCKRKRWGETKVYKQLDRHKWIDIEADAFIGEFEYV